MHWPVDRQYFGYPETGSELVKNPVKVLLVKKNPAAATIAIKITSDFLRFLVAISIQPKIIGISMCDISSAAFESITLMTPPTMPM